MKPASSCSNCGSSQGHLIHKANAFGRAGESFDLIECAGCLLIRTDPTPDVEELGKYYEETYYGGNGAKFNPWTEWLIRLGRRRLAGKLCSLVSPVKTPRVLDVGCGRGTLLVEMNRRGAQCFGTDIADFRSNLESERMVFLRGDLLSLNLPSESFDIVTIWHVLEHTRQVSETVKKMSCLLKRDGILTISVPNFGSRQAKVFGPCWFHLDAPRHLFHFRRADLLELLRQNDLLLLEESTSLPSQNLYGFVQSALNRLLSSRPPNELYSLLKTGSTSATRKFAGLVLYAPLVIPLFVAACLAEIRSLSRNDGATLTVIARKVGTP